MMYAEFQGWLIRNRPLHMPENDFLEFCALCGVLTIQNTIENEGLTITELVNKFFADRPVSHQ